MSSGTGPRWPDGVEGMEHPVEADPGAPVRRDAAHGAGAARAPGGRAWDHLGRDGAGHRRHATGGGDRRRACGANLGYPLASLRSRPMTSPAELQAQADAIGWYHTIDLGNGVVTKGISVQETGPSVLPDVSGRSVLDIGAWDGKFSFLAEKAGATRVVALDHYAWGVDFVARGAVLGRVHRERAPSPTSRATRPTSGGPTSRDGAASNLAAADAGLQGRAGRGRLPDGRPRRAGAVRRRPLPRRAVPHEGAADLPRTGARRDQGGGRHRDRGGAPPRPRHEVLLQFHAGSSLRTDFGNWYVPTIEALHNLCRAAGFSGCARSSGRPSRTPEPPGHRKVRLGRRLAGISPPPPSAPSENYRAVVHAYV